MSLGKESLEIAEKKMYDDCKEKISQAVARGQVFTDCSINLSVNHRQQLKNEGFRVECGEECFPINDYRLKCSKKCRVAWFSGNKPLLVSKSWDTP